MERPSGKWRVVGRRKLIKSSRRRQVECPSALKVGTLGPMERNAVLLHPVESNTRLKYCRHVRLECEEPSLADRVYQVFS